MNEPNHHQIATYLIDYALSELVKYVMEDTGCSIEEAMERVYNSDLMPALQDEEGELYAVSIRDDDCKQETPALSSV